MVLIGVLGVGLRNALGSGFRGAGVGSYGAGFRVWGLGFG